MKYIELPDKTQHRLPFYLAMEEFVARHLNEDECFFMWQVEPTVIFGRNQLIENEVNIDFCRAHNIQTYRRKSGGGCVYSDPSNIMFSYIVRAENVSFTFDRYIRMIAFVLRKLGIPAEASGRNDIMINGKKVSGNAFYHLPGKSIVHGTMLFNTDMENLIRAITPSNEKLISKGVESIRQHVTNLSEYLTMDIEEFKTFVRTQLCDGTIKLSDNDVKEIQAIEEEYLTDEFIYGNNPRYTLVKRGKTPMAGELEIRMELKNGIIKKINLMGDFFLTGDLDHGLLEPLTNVPYEENAIRNILKYIQLKDIILHLDEEQFMNILFKKE